MARILLGTIVTAISGKVGGNVFKGSISGTVLQVKRSRRSNVNGSTANLNARAGNPSGSTIGDAVSYCAKYWKILTVAEKAAWSAAAPNFPTYNSLGVPSKPNGYHCFLHINIRLYYMSAAVTLAPPASYIGNAPIDFTISSLTLSTVTTVLGEAVPSGYMMYIKATAPLSAGIKPSKSQFRTINYISAGTSGSINNITQYQASFGKPVVGQTIWIATQLSNLLTGVLGQLYVVAAVVS
jgi:hypothetical protein